MKIAELNIKEMFTAHENAFNGGQAHDVQYFCVKCNQCFAVDWGIAVSSMNPWALRGSFVRCPFCGTVHDRFIGRGKLHEFIPQSMKISVVAFKTALRVRVKYEGRAFVGLFDRSWCYNEEVFYFDFKARKATFQIKKQIGRNAVETAICPIILDYFLTIMESSGLRFLHSSCLANKFYRSNVTNVIKAIREASSRILENVGDRKIGSLYVESMGYEYGRFLLPLLNVAHRMQAPELTNLSQQTKLPKLLDRLYTFPASMSMPENWNERILERMKQEQVDALTAIAQEEGLPVKDVVRSMIKENYLRIQNLKMALGLVRNLDLAVRLAVAGELDQTRIDFFKELIPIYREEGVVRFAEREKEYQLKDCIRLYNQLNEENKALMKEERLRLRQLHDWLAKVHRHQTHKNKAIAVPEEIVRRMSMQRERLRFFLPKETIELVEAGHELHNCIASYGTDMVEGKRWVVLVTDNRGKIIAGIEIKDNAIRQAKIDGNKPVANDRAVNRAVIEWAKEAKLEVDTSDIELTLDDIGKLKIS